MCAQVRKQAEEKLGKPLVQHKAAIKIMVQEFFAGWRRGLTVNRKIVIK